MSNKNTRRLKGYYPFSKKFPSQRGTVYAIAESKRRKKKELRNKILLTVFAFVLFVAILTAYLFCLELSKKPIPDETDKTTANTAVSADNIGAIKAIFIDNSVIGDEKDLDAKLKNAKENGFNAIMLDFKDKDGDVLFPSAVKVPSLETEKEVISKEIIDKIKAQGFTVVARVYCFCDSVAPQRTGAYVFADEDRTKPWFDNSAVLDGRVWLNPTDSRATKYLTSIIGEVSRFGADCIYLQSVEFPVSKTSKPIFTEDDTTLSRNFVLLEFLEDATKGAGDVPVIVGFSFDGIDGDSEKWGGTLFDSAAAACSPEIPVVDEYAKHVGNLWTVLNDRAKNNFTTLRVVPTVHENVENDNFYSELASFGAESYIIIP